MNVRPIEVKDIEEIKRIHENYFKDEFDFKLDHCLASFIIEDNEGIVSAGGIKSIVESIQVSNQERSSKVRIEALKLMKLACAQAAANLDYDQIHVFIQNQLYQRQLIKSGFRLSKGNCLVLDI